MSFLATLSNTYAVTVAASNQAFGGGGGGGGGGSGGSGGVFLRNKIINGSFAIDQRNAGQPVYIANDGVVYGPDKLAADVNTGASGFQYTLQQRALTSGDVGVVSVGGGGITNSCRMTVNSNVAFAGSSNWLGLGHVIEGIHCQDLFWGQASGNDVAFSMWMKTNVTGTHHVSFHNGACNMSYVYPFNVGAADTWTRVSAAIPVPSSGAWETTSNAGVIINIDNTCEALKTASTSSWLSGNYVCPSPYNSNLWKTAGNYVEITGLQFEKGAAATAFEARPMGYELALCQRYYETSFPLGMKPQNNTSNMSPGTEMYLQGQYGTGFVYFKQPKSSIPAIWLYNPWDTIGNAEMLSVAGYISTNLLQMNQNINGFGVRSEDTGLQNQMVTFNWVADTMPTWGILDALTPAQFNACMGAFSLKRLTRKYTGPMVRIRRSSDSVESDFYGDFAGYALGQSLNGTGVRLVTWLNGATGYVKTWYNQAVVGVDLTQTTPSLQPIIDASKVRFVAASSTGLSASGISLVNKQFSILIKHDHISSSGALISQNGSYGTNQVFHALLSTTSISGRYYSNDLLLNITGIQLNNGAATYYFKQSGTGRNVTYTYNGQQYLASDTNTTLLGGTAGISLGRIGVDGSNPFNGGVYEAYMFQNSIPSTDLIYKYLAGDVTIPATASLIDWTPDIVSGVQNWYDAYVGVTTVSGAVSQWNDRSTNTRNATQSSSSLRPIYKATGLNSRPSIDFEGVSGRILSCGGPGNITQFTIACVLYLTFNSIYQQWFTSNSSFVAGALHLLHNNTNRGTHLAIAPGPANLNAFTYTDGVPYLFVLTGSISSSTSTSYTTFNGSTPSSFSVTGLTSFLMSSMSLGNDVNSPERALNGGISEFVMYNKVLTDGERQQLEGYLAWKWWGSGSILPSSHPYKNAKPYNT